MAIKPLADGALGGIRPGWLSVLHLARQVSATLCGAALRYAMLCCRYTALCSTVQRSAECIHTKRRAVLRAVASPRSCAR